MARDTHASLLTKLTTCMTGDTPPLAALMACEEKEVPGLMNLHKEQSTRDTTRWQLMGTQRGMLRNHTAIRKQREGMVITQQTTGTAVMQLRTRTAIMRLMRSRAILQPTSGVAIRQLRSSTAIMQPMSGMAIMQPIRDTVGMQLRDDMAVMRLRNGMAIMQRTCGMAAIMQQRSSTRIMQLRSSLAIMRLKIVKQLACLGMRPKGLTAPASQLVLLMIQELLLIQLACGRILLNRMNHRTIARH
mmetsp:Transcript_47237/g.136474  ORF Transcript_47237/g.136474 Transcript_47237/m.136474 type:complete len:245 (+) Transcript_47237:257-991(+)